MANTASSPGKAAMVPYMVVKVLEWVRIAFRFQLGSEWHHGFFGGIGFVHVPGTRKNRQAVRKGDWFPVAMPSPERVPGFLKVVYHSWDDCRLYIRWVIVF